MANKTIGQLDSLDTELSFDVLFPIWSEEEKDTYKILTRDLVEYFFEPEGEKSIQPEENWDDDYLLIDTFENELKKVSVSTVFNILKNEYIENDYFSSEDQVFGTNRAISIDSGNNLNNILDNGKYYNSDGQASFQNSPLEKGEKFSMIVENLTPKIQRQTIYPSSFQKMKYIEVQNTAEKTRDLTKEYYIKEDDDYILDTSSTFIQGVTYYEKIEQKNSLYYIRDIILNPESGDKEILSWKYPPVVE